MRAWQGLAAVASVAAAQVLCSVPIGVPVSLRAYRNSSTGTPLFFRHAGFVGWITPVDDSMDDLDSTFLTHEGLSGAANTVSFESVDFPGYYIAVDASNTTLVNLIESDGTPAFAAAATWIPRAGRADAGGGCSFESAQYPGTFMATYNEPVPASTAADTTTSATAAASSHAGVAASPAAAALQRVLESSLYGSNGGGASGGGGGGSGGRGSRRDAALRRYRHMAAPHVAARGGATDTPCHYSVCTEVFALAPPPGGDAAGFNASSTFYIAPPNAQEEVVAYFTAGGLTVGVNNVTGTVASIAAVGDPSAFNYVRDSTARVGPGFHHVGDVTVRLREYSGGGAYVQDTTAALGPSGNAVPTPIAPQYAGGLHAADITPMFAAAGALLGLTVHREYVPAADGRGVLMVFTLTAGGGVPIEVGAFGTSTVFNNDWTGLTLQQNAESCSLVDPYIGGDGGYLQVVRITGQGPVLLMAPAPCGQLLDGAAGAGVANATFCGGRLEAWRMLSEDPSPTSGTFEGFYDWMVTSAAWAEAEWAQAQPWNQPTSLVLNPGESAVIGFRLWLTPNDTAAAPQQQGVRAIPDALADVGMPLVQAVPGLVIPADMTTARLLVRPPPGLAIMQMDVEPAGALEVGAPTGPINGSWFSVPVAVASGASSFGRVRVSIVYGSAASRSAHNGAGQAQLTQQSVHLFTTPALPSLVNSYAQFTEAKVFFTDDTEPFGRGHSFMGWDASVNGIILQEDRAFIAGLSDEAGAGAGLGFAVHEAYAPDALGVAQVATYVNRTLRNTKLDARGVPVSVQGDDFSVRASLFWGPGMPNYPYTTNPCWDEPRSNTTWRAYNYVHPTAVLYHLYLLSRNYPGLVAATNAVAAGSSGSLDGLAADPLSYLEAAANTILAMGNFGSQVYDLSQFGLMVGSVHAAVIKALQAEGLTALANAVIALQSSRMAIWAALPFPFGSEFPFDSTGQEEIYTFSQFFANYSVANATLLSVLSYTPLVPHWAYSGSARRYWDYAVNGKIVIAATERALQHYGSGINSVPLMSAYRLFPNDTHLLRAGFAASWGALTNINPLEGWPAMGFHGDAGQLVHEPYSADYGVGLYGSAQQWGCYATWEPAERVFGLLAYGCDAAGTGALPDPSIAAVTLTPRDAYHRQLHIGPAGLSIVLEAGTWTNATLDFTASGAPLLTVWLSQAATPLGGAVCGMWFPSFRVRIIDDAAFSRVENVRFNQPTVQPPVSRSAYELPCTTASFTLSWQWTAEARMA